MTMKPAPPANPIDVLWQASVLIWVILAGEGLAAILSLAPGIQGGRWVYFGLTSLITQWVTLSTLGTMYLFRHPLARLKPQQIVYVALAILLLITALVFAMAWGLFPAMWNSNGGRWKTSLLQFSGISLTVGVLGVAAFQNHWRTQQLAVRAKQAELDALQARIRPHFLFNTLNTSVALVHQRPQDAERVLMDLADLFRASLAGANNIALEDELALTRRYLDIEQMRLGNRLCVEWSLPSPLPDAVLPSLSIQPLVENAIRHGIEPRPDGGTVTISATARDGRLLVEISNPLAPSGIVRTGHQVGQQAVRARLLKLAGEDARLDFDIRDECYIATLAIPLLPR